MLAELILLILAFLAVLLFIRWRTRLAIQKLLIHPVPEVGLGLPAHPDGTLLLFHHPRCGPCLHAVKYFDHIANTNPERVLKINIADQPTLTLAFDIRVTPTILFIKNNIVSAAFIGATSLQKLQALLMLTP